MYFKLYFTLVLASLMLLPSVAHAHLVATQFGDFYSSMLHPITALEYIVPWLALGLLAGIQGGISGRWMLLVFPLGVLVGTDLAWVVPPLALVSELNLASFIVPGALVALAWHLPMAVILGLGIIFGITHGYENGLMLSATGQASLSVAGVATSSYIVIALFTASTVTFLRRTSWGKVAVRAVGSWITAIGLMMLGFTYFVS